MGDKDESKLLRDLGAFGVLMNFLTSIKDQREYITKAVQDMFPEIVNPREYMTSQFKKLLEMVIYNAANNITLRKFEQEASQLIDCLEDPVLTLEDEELREAIQIHITRTRKALMYAVGGNFEVKEYIQNMALVDVLRNISILDTQQIVPAPLKEMIEKMKARIKD